MLFSMQFSQRTMILFQVPLTEIKKKKQLLEDEHLAENILAGSFVRY